MEIAVTQPDLGNAPIATNNLSELELLLGQIGQAMEDARLAVEYADRSGKTFQKIARRAIYANVMQQSGASPEALILFEEAERIQTEWEPKYLKLYSVQGFLYCELLLAEAERAAWQVQCGDASPKLAGGIASHTSRLKEVEERAEQARECAIQNNFSLLSHAVDQLTMGRVLLYSSVLGQGTSEQLNAIEATVDALCRAGAQQYLPLGLLTRSWLRVRQGDLIGAQADLDEAREIAERGPMPLHQADILLHRARLFFCEATYPWRNEDGTPRSAKLDLAEARRLIEKHGYWRRKEELADAEAVIGQLA
jgi:hypothetical protein